MAGGWSGLFQFSRLRVYRVYYPDKIFSRRLHALSITQRWCQTGELYTKLQKTMFENSFCILPPVLQSTDSLSLSVDCKTRAKCKTIFVHIKICAYLIISGYALGIPHLCKPIGMLFHTRLVTPFKNLCVSLFGNTNGYFLLKQSR